MTMTTTQKRAVFIGPDLLIPELRHKAQTILDLMEEHRDEDQLIRLEAKAQAVTAGADALVEALEIHGGDYDTAYQTLLATVTADIDAIKMPVKGAEAIGNRQGLCLVQETLDLAL